MLASSKHPVIHISSLPETRIHVNRPGPASAGYTYGGYYGSPAYSPSYGSGYSPASYGGYGSSPAAPPGGYYSATPSTLFGSGRSLLSFVPDENVMGQPAGLEHFGSAFPSNAWQFVHHKSPSGTPRAAPYPNMYSAPLDLSCTMKAHQIHHGLHLALTSA